MRPWVRFAIAGAASAAILVAVQILLTRRPTLPLGHDLELLSPGALRLAALLPYLWLVRGASLTDLARGQQWLSLGVRALLTCALALALARPSVVAERRAVATVVLVDASDSVSDRQLEDARAFVGKLRAEQAKSPDHSLHLVAFAGHPHVVPLPAYPAAPLDLPVANLRPKAFGEKGDASDLQAALELAQGLYPPGTIRRAVLLSDGNQTQGDLLGAAAACARHGVRLSARPFAAEHDDEVLVRELRLPDGGVRIGAPFQVTAEIYASRPVPATVTLFQDEFVNPLDGTRKVTLDAGKNVLRFKSEVKEAGFVTYRLAVSGLPADFHDRFPANDAAQAAVAVKGRPRVLYIEGEPPAATYLARALERENLDVDVRGPYGLPSSARELQKYDLVLVSDVPSSYMGLSQMAAIESYVRDQGGGFLMAGGENSFGSGGYQGTKIEQLLPVRFDTEKKRDQPSLALALAIDRSGSMQGDKLELAKDAAKASAEILAPDDLIGVIAFDSQAQPLVRLQRAANRIRIVSDISRLTAGGGTNLLAPLQEAYQELAPARAKVKHVILLTDGQASYEGIAELTEEMVAAKITVSAVGVGAGADKTLLAMIAERGGGRFYFTQDAQNIPKIFTKETNEVARSALVEEAIQAHVAKRVELLDGVGIESAPYLRGYVATKPKPLTETILVSDLGEPLLARWRVGIGQSAAWTSDVKNRWAAEWVRWPGYGKFFAQVIRSLMRHRPPGSGTGESGFAMSTEVDPPVVRVAIDAVGNDDRFVNGLATTLEVSGAGQKARSVNLAQTAAGRYEGEFPLDRYGSFQLRAVHKREGQVVSESSGTLSVPYPREYLALPPDEALLARAAVIGGGVMRPAAAAMFDPGSEKVIWHKDLWSWALWVAVGLLALDVMMRRVRMFGYRRS
jgi:Ca-activated chloride channel homolog